MNKNREHCKGHFTALPSSPSLLITDLTKQPTNLSLSFFFYIITIKQFEIRLTYTQILRGQIIQGLISKHENFKINTETNMKPLQFFQDWCNVLPCTGPRQNPMSRILYLL